MLHNDATVDAVIIGGGFYGASIAVYLAKQRGLKRIMLVERESALMMRASYNNQARIHNGYHYPRSFNTAYRSRINLPRFVKDLPHAVKQDFTNLYAIAKRNSKVTAKQFVRFCKEIGAKVEPVNQSTRQLFERNLIEDVFLVEEYAFDTTKLASWAESELKECGVEILLNVRVTSISKVLDALKVVLTAQDQSVNEIVCRNIFNCTYSGLNQFTSEFPITGSKLKHEITEMTLMQVPPALACLGITVMDGPFFSLMPFPARGLHTLSHVRYTPHTAWKDERGIDPYEKLKKHDCASRVDRMVRDAQRYLPVISEAQYVDSLFEIKTILVKSEGDDSRPILFEKHSELPGCYSVLGGKIDNIYDVLERLDEEII